jgi:membrane protein YdbS with pleckstrin-like domain
MSIELRSNQQVELSGTCKVEDMVLNSLSPKYRSLNIIVSLIIGFVIVAIILLLAIQPLVSMPQKYLDYYHIAAIAVAFLTLWSVLYSYFADPKKKYAIREFDVHFQSGLLFFRTVSQPIMRIQHIEIERGPIERSAGLATLQVYSAGGANHAFEIPGLVHEKAIELRQFILNHKDVSQNG